MILRREFYQRPTVEVAQDLLGKILVRRAGRSFQSGRIVETEAYLAGNDSACHANKHRTPRTEVMFAAGGVAYVYPIHAKYCFNVVTEGVDSGCAVLIRALEPMKGISTMIGNRGLDDPRRLTTGPGCLCQALAIDRGLNGHDLATGKRIWVEDDGFRLTADQLGRSPRIGVTSAKQSELRFYHRGNRFVSGPRRMRQ